MSGPDITEAYPADGKIFTSHAKVVAKTKALKPKLNIGSFGGGEVGELSWNNNEERVATVKLGIAELLPQAVVWALASNDHGAEMPSMCRFLLVIDGIPKDQQTFTLSFVEEAEATHYYQGYEFTHRLTSKRASQPPLDIEIPTEWKPGTLRDLTDEEGNIDEVACEARFGFVAFAAQHVIGPRLPVDLRPGNEQASGEDEGGVAT